MGDLRIPIGLFFTLEGSILILTGVLHPEARAALTEVNVNLYCGACMLAFGSVMLWLGRRNSS